MKGRREKEEENNKEYLKRTIIHFHHSFPDLQFWRAAAPSPVYKTEWRLLKASRWRSDVRLAMFQWCKKLRRELILNVQMKVEWWKKGPSYETMKFDKVLLLPFDSHSNREDLRRMKRIWCISHQFWRKAFFFFNFPVSSMKDGSTFSWGFAWLSLYRSTIFLFHQGFTKSFKKPNI